MNKKIIKLIISSFSIFLIAGCNDLKNLEIPESISVKSEGARYEFPLGSGTMLLRDKLSAKKLRETFNEGKDENDPQIKAYLYKQADKDCLQYLIKYPIEEISMALTEGDTDINKIDLNSKINLPNLNDNINSGFGTNAVSFPFIEAGSTITLPDTSVDFDVTVPIFSSITVYTGSSLTLTVKPDAPFSSGFEMRISLDLYDKNTNSLIASGDGEKQILSGGTDFVFNFTDSSVICPHMKLKISGTISGGTLGISNSCSVSMTPNLKIKKITGLYMSSEDIGTIGGGTEPGVADISDVFTLNGLNHSMKEAIIEEGSLDFSCLLPEGWSGIKCTTEFDITGGMNLPKAVIQDQTDPLTEVFKKHASLNDLTITDNPVSFDGKVSISLENADIILEENNRSTELELKGVCKVDKLKSITVDISALANSECFNGEVDTGLSFSSLLADSLKNDGDKLLKNITFKGIESYLYAIEPDIDDIKGIKFYGSLKASYTDKDGAAKSDVSLIDIASSATDDEKIHMCEPVDFDGIASDETFIIESRNYDFRPGSYSAAVESSSICNIINDLPDDLKIKYDFTIESSVASEITITGENIEKLKNQSGVEIFMIIKIPLMVELADKCDFPVEKYIYDKKITIYDALLIADMNIDEDLLKRDDADDKPKWLDYADLIESVKLVYTNVNTTGMDLKAVVIADNPSDPDAPFLKKELSFESGKAELKLTTEEVKKVFDNYPFQPRIEITIPTETENTPGSFIQDVVVPWDGAFGISGKISIVTGGQVKIWGDDDGDKE